MIPSLQPYPAFANAETFPFRLTTRDDSSREQLSLVDTHRACIAELLEAVPGLRQSDVVKTAVHDIPAPTVPQTAHALVRGAAGVIRCLPCAKGISPDDKRRILALIRELRHHPVDAAEQVKLRSLLETYRTRLQPKLPTTLCFEHKRSKDVGRALFLAKLTPKTEAQQQQAQTLQAPPRAKTDELKACIQDMRLALQATERRIRQIENEIAGQATGTMLMAGIMPPNLSADLRSLHRALKQCKDHRMTLESRIARGQALLDRRGD